SIEAFGGASYAWGASGSGSLAGSTNNNATVNFGTVGGATVMVTVTTPAGQVETYTRNVSVNAPGTGDVDGPDAVYPNQEGVVFTVPDNAGSDYEWTIPGGATIVSNDGNSITVNFGTNGGTVSVVETTSGGGTINYTTNVTMEPLLSPALTITGPGSVDAGQNGVAYSIEAFGGASYAWGASGSGSLAGSTNNNATVNFGTVGGATVTVTVTTPAGQVETYIRNVTVNAPGTGDVDGPDAVYPNQEGVVFTVPNNAGSDYAWTIPNGATIVSNNGNSITVNFGTNGGTVSVIETTSGGGTANYSTNVTMETALNPDLQITGPVSVDPGQTGVNYSVPAYAGATYVWSSTGNATLANSTNNNASFNFGTSGEGTVSVTITTPAGQTRTYNLNVDIEEEQEPVLDPTWQITGSGTASPGETGVNYSIPQYDGANYTWGVSGSATIVGTGNTASVNFGGEESVTVSVTVTTPGGQSETYTRVVTVVDNAEFFISGPTVVEPGQSGVVYSFPMIAGANYAWNASVATTQMTMNENTLTLNFGTMGSVQIYLTVIDENGGETDYTRTVYVRTMSGPQTVAENQTNVTYSVPQNPGSTYQWTIPDDATIVESNGHSVTINFGSNGGVVSVIETDANGNVYTTDRGVSITGSDPNSILAGSESSVELYPNPFMNSAEFKISSATTADAQVRITNIKGIEVSSYSVKTNESHRLGDELPAGVYIIHVTLGDEIKVLKVIKL
ncbi:MAG: T9SS type A sorting domain-containing protein, partial [Cytophagaceae bacterium]